VLFLLVVATAGLGGYAVLVRLGVDDLDAWAGGRLAGLVLVAMPAWWIGVAGFGAWRAAGTVMLIAVAAVGVREVWRRRRNWRELVSAEAIFIAGMAAVLLIRLDHPQIAGQEKPMDVGILATLLRATEFPPPDMWLAGEPLPYYYWGALVWTVPMAVSKLPLEFAYNLVVGIVGGLTFATLWVLGRRLAGGSHAAGLLAGFVGLLAGTPDGVRQLLAGTGIRSLDIWRSSRQHPDVITEFPLFTAWLGDLHPHLLSMPIAALALLVAWWAGRSGPKIGHVTALAVLFGVTWAANPWAMPPTFAGIVTLLLTADGRWPWPTAEGRGRWLAAVVVAGGGWLVTAPFHVAFQPFFEGIRPVFAWTEPATLLLYAGHLVVPVFGAALVVARERLGSESPKSPGLILAGAALVVVIAAATQRPTLVVLAVGVLLTGLWTLGTSERSERPAVALAALGLFLLVLPEIVYVVDSYGDRLHRMNTVFKSYIQAWMVLALALPVLVRMTFRRVVARRVLVAAVVACGAPHLLWAVLNQFSARSLGLDGFRGMWPGDRAIVRFLRDQPPGTTLIEAVGGAYSEYGRLSAHSGVPAYLGWENHELVWRGHSVTQETSRRRRLIDELYSCRDPEVVRQLVAGSGVDLVAIGFLERQDFPAAGLEAVRAAGNVVLDDDNGVLVGFGERLPPR
jgi:YYY domain-containing protein